jgi:N-acetylneuraminate synthase
MSTSVKIGNKLVGEGQPCYFIAEIGLNHNGDIEIAKKLIDTAVFAGCDAVKFQKRTPELCVPMDQREVMRDTPWGRMTYMDYRYRVEFGEKEYAEIDRYCKEKGIDWYASCFDEEAVDFIEQFNPVAYKLASSFITNEDLMNYTRKFGKPIIMSTGMSTMEQIRHAVDVLGKHDLVILHATSIYPTKPQEVNLRMIQTLKQEFGLPTGYSGHEVGLQITLAASVMGACCVERHITLDRAMWGGDHAASIEPQGLLKLLRDIRICEVAMGDGVKKVYERELPNIAKLRNK